MFFAASPAGAGYLSHHDADDTESQLDFRMVRLAHRHDRNRAIVVVRRYERHHSDYFEVHAYFDSRGGPRADHQMVASYDRASGGWWNCDVRARSHGSIGSCSVREHRRTWKFTFRWRLLSPNKPVRWRLAGEDPVQQVVDRAPDEGFYSN